VPACLSSRVARLCAHRVPGGQVAPERCSGLLAFLAKLPDPRDRRGLRHELVGVLAVAVCAVLAGAKSFTAIGEWAADAAPSVLRALGVRADPLTGVVQAPDEATVRRLLTAIDADALDAAVGAWLVTLPSAPAVQPPSDASAVGVPRRAVGVDGKTLCGSGPAGAQVHLLAAMDHVSRAVLAQVQVDGKSNEITAFRPLLHGIDLTGAVVTADAMHTQRDHADYLISVKNAAHICIVKRNQPGLYRQLKSLPWTRVPVQAETHDRGHGRYEIRRLQVVSSDRLDFPDAAQAIRLTRRVRDQKTKKWRTVTVYAITSLTAVQAGPAELAGHIRGHWGIEVLHHIRDVTYTRGRLPGPYRQRPPSDGQPAEPRHRHPAPRRPLQHRPDTAPQRPRRLAITGTAGNHLTAIRHIPLARRRPGRRRAVVGEAAPAPA
jgi:predicted transposase YbfD/YdcC